MAENIAQELEELERQLQQPGVRNDPEMVTALLASEFVEFGSSGRIWHKCEIVEALRHERKTPAIRIRSFRAQLLAPEVMLVTYVASSPAETLRSSIWVHRDGRWQMLFHQGTPTKASEQ